jgi:hypothetical protein
MIILIFAGGLGNQMFTYALGRHLSIKNNQLLKLNYLRYADIEPDWEKGERIFTLNKFNIVGEAASKEEVGKYYKYYKPDTFARRLSVKFYDILYGGKPYYAKPYMIEPPDSYMNFDLELLNHKYKNVYIRGFFQSEKYFKDIEDTIRKDFTLKEPQNKEYYDMLSKINGSNSISVIVRRGDYLKPEVQKVYCQCAPDYFQRSVEMIAEKVGNPKLFVLSDGLEWVKENIRFPYPVEYVSHETYTDYQKLMFMSACKHHVISNSTYAWWIAWLGINPDKMVIAPKNWLVDEKKNEKYLEHLIPEKWLQI